MSMSMSMSMTSSSLFRTASVPALSRQTSLAADHISPTISMNMIGGGGGGRFDRRIKIGAYYHQLLKSNPTDALLLGNYAKFLHQVEKDPVRAVEYCGRAILANPGDPELLSLYGKLIWETEGDHVRAKSYFHHALLASPNHCSILGSYAHFMWEAETKKEN